MVDFNKMMAEAKAKREATVVAAKIDDNIKNSAEEAKEAVKELGKVMVESTTKTLSFMQQLAAKAAAKVTVEDKDRPIGIPEVAPIPKVISAANLAAKATEGQAEAEVTGETKAALDNIRQKIHDIQEMNNGELNGAMTTLREMLRANPDACSLMLPEDTGLMVRALRKMTGNTQALSLVNAKGSKKATTKEVELSVEEVLKLAAEGGTDGWD